MAERWFATGQDRMSWVTFTGIDGSDGVHLHLVDGDDGRTVVAGVYVHAPEVTSAMLRDLPLVRLAEDARFRTRSVKRKQGDGADVTIAALEQRVKRSKRLADTVPPTRDIDVLRTWQADDPPRFRRAVAEIYQLEVRSGTRGPAKKLSDDWDVPVTTVHRWIREARLSGDLPPARKGVRG